MGRARETTSLWAAGRLGKGGRGGPRVIFGQVREDAAVELAALDLLGPGQRVFVIGSGGCTAFSLLAARPRAVHAVDINPAQVHLIELKRAGVARLPYADLLACVTRDARAFYPALRPALSAEAAAFWDTRGALLAAGLAQCGEVERQLRRAMRLFRLAVHPRARVEAALSQTDPARQERFYAEQWNSWRWRAALALGLSRHALRLVYGRELIEALPEDFAGLVSGSLARAFVATPTAENGYLWQTFLGRYPPSERALPIYLQPAHHPEVARRIGCVATEQADAAEWLARREAGTIGFFALSNILEVTSRDAVARLAAAVTRAARPGALVCLRWILPPPRDLMERLAGCWRAEERLAQELSRRDRSLFCKFIHLYRVEG